MKKLTLIYILIISAGCATTGSNQRNTVSSLPSFEAKVVSDENMVSPISSVLMSEVKPGLCSKKYEKWKSGFKWKDAIDACTACLRAGDLNKAEDVAEELSRRELSNPWGPYYQAVVARAQNHIERASWMTELALKRAPQSGLIQYLRGQILWDQKQYDPAVLAFEKAVTLDKSILPAHLILGQIYFRDQEWGNAIAHFSVVLAKESKNRAALYGYAQSQMELKNGIEALSAFDRLSDLEPKDGYYLSQMGEIQENMLHQPSAALGTYQKLSKKIKLGQIDKNTDDKIDMKIKKLEAELNKSRAVASEKKGDVK